MYKDDVAIWISPLYNLPTNNIGKLKSYNV